METSGDNQTAPLARERQTLVRAADFLAAEVRRYDPDAQAHFLGNVCNLLVRFNILGGMFGVITITSDLSLSWRLRSYEVIPHTEWDRVQELFAVQNARTTTARWFLATNSNEVQFAGECTLRGQPLRDKRQIRRCLLRPVERMHRKIGRMFVERPPKR